MAGAVIGMATPASATSSPVVDAVIPNHGTVAGGTGLQITGSGFTGATAVAFGSTIVPQCPSSGPCFNVNGDNGISANSPAHSLGTVDVTVTTAGGTSAPNADDKFTYDPPGPPVVSGVSPRSGPATGGTAVQILGSGFIDATAVAFGSTTVPPCLTGSPPAAGGVSKPVTRIPRPRRVLGGGGGGLCFNVNGDNGIFTNSPPGTANPTPVDVTVTVGGGTSATSTADKFTYVAPGPPVVDAVDPNHGTAAGGTNVQITGSGFTGATAVAFGTATLVPCTPSSGPCFNVNGDNQINANSPPGTASPTPVDVTVTNAGGTSAANAYDKFTYDPVGPPVVSGVSPRSGPATGGTAVQILGSGFTGATAVAFGTATLVPCTPSSGPCFNVNGDNGINANSPPGTASPTPVDVTVTTPVAVSAISPSDKFLYTSVTPAALIVDAVDPNHGTAAGGTNVQITGSGFTSATAVAFGTATLVLCTPSSFGPCFNINGDNGINANSPPGTASPTPVDVTVTNAGGTSATNAYDKFTYDPVGPPVVSGVSPRSGPATGGTGVQILGSGFTAATAIAFGTTTIPPCPSSGNCFFRNGDGSIFANSPAHSAGTVDVTVTTALGTSATSNEDKFAYVATTTTVVTSSSNPSTVGSNVTYTATVAPTPNGGTVAFTDNGVTLTGCGAVAVNTSTGKATCTTKNGTFGSHSIVASYSGDTYYTASSGSLIQQVNHAATSQSPPKAPGPRGSSGAAQSSPAPTPPPR